MESKSRRIVLVAISEVAIATMVLAVVLVTPALSALRETAPRGDVTLLVREDVKNLSAKQKAEFVAAVKKAKTVSSPWNPAVSYYDQFVLWHREAFKCSVSWDQGGNWAGAAHNSPTFLPWHRQFLDLFEEMLQQMSGNPRLALPYWDWTDAESTAAVFSDDFLGGNGDPKQQWGVTTGPFRKGEWQITIQDPKVLLKGNTAPKSFIVRNFGAFEGEEVSLPTAADVRATIAQGHRYDHAPYDAQSPLGKSFRNRLEGWRDATPAQCQSGWVDQSQAADAPHAMHNLVHIYTGGIWSVGDKTSEGTMAYNTSPNDPVFFVHHANVDRIWAAWELQGGSHYTPKRGAEYGWNASDTMWPWFDRTINSWSSTVRNGYRYAALPR